MLEKDFITLYNLIGSLIQTHKDALFTEKELSQLSLRQTYYIKQIGQLTNPTLTDLAHVFKVTKPSVTVIVNHLIELGYIEKIQSRSDLRVFTVRLTPRGERLARVDEEALMEFCSQARSVLSEKENEEFEFLLARLVTALK